MIAIIYKRFMAKRYGNQRTTLSELAYIHFITDIHFITEFII